MMSAIAVKVRAATDGKAVTVRETPIMCFDRGVVVAVPGLQRREAGDRQSRHQIVAARQCGVCKGGDPTGGANHRDHVSRAGARSGDEARTPAADEPVEGVRSINCVSRRNQCVSDVRAADTGACLAFRDEMTDVDATSERAQAFCDRSDTANPVGALPAKKLRQAGIGGIEEVAEDVNVLVPFNGGNLDAGDESHPGSLRGGARLTKTRSRVVIGDADDLEAGARGSDYELGW